MQLVEQTAFVDPDGHSNALSACLATVLGIPGSSVPDFHDPAQFVGPGSPNHLVVTDSLVDYVHQEDMRPDWWIGMAAWLRLLNKHLVSVSWKGRRRLIGNVHVPTYVIAAGEDPRQGRDKFHSHACVYRWEPYKEDWALYHDPHPSMDGLASLPYSLYVVRDWTPIGE